MKRKIVALVTGDGSGPEMMAPACKIAIEAARRDDIDLVFEETPMGWSAYDEYDDTLPKKSFDRAVEIGTIFFGGVGDPRFDATTGARRPEMKPEARCLLALRKRMGLLLNFRPVIFYKELAYLAKVRSEAIPDDGVQQIWIRFLLQDSYFGNEDYQRNPVFAPYFKIKSEITGDEPVVLDLAYYDLLTLEKYFRAAFMYAKTMGLPLISVDKANAISRYVFWRKVATRIGKEFPGVPLAHQYVDSANALLFDPAKLHGVIACGNEHGDILSDGAAAAVGSIGLMCSSAINPDTGAAMFESGGGTAPTLAGQNKANPIGRILTVAMMLRHLGALNGATAIDEAVKVTLRAGFRTEDLLGKDPEVAAKLVKTGLLLGTKEMGETILHRL